MSAPPGSAVLAAMRDERARLALSGRRPAAFVLGSLAYVWLGCELGEASPRYPLEVDGLPVLVLGYAPRGLISCVASGADGQRL